MTKLKWQTGEPPEGELVIFEAVILQYPLGNSMVKTQDISYRIDDGMFCSLGEYSGINSDEVSRWVLYSDFLKVVE